MRKNPLDERLSELERLVGKLVSENERLERLLCERDEEINALMNCEYMSMTYDEFATRATIILNTKQWQTPFAKQTGINRFVFQRYAKIGVVPKHVVMCLEELAPAEKTPKLKWTPEMRSEVVRLYEITVGNTYEEKIAKIGEALREKFGVTFQHNQLTSQLSRARKDGKLRSKPKGRKAQNLTGANVSSNTDAFVEALVGSSPDTKRSTAVA